MESAQANEAKLYLAERDVWHHMRLGRGQDVPTETFWSDRTLQHLREQVQTESLRMADPTCGLTKTNGYFTLVNFVQGVHIKQSLSRAPRPTERKPAM